MRPALRFDFVRRRALGSVIPFLLIVSGALALGHTLRRVWEVEEAITYESNAKSAFEVEAKKRAAVEALAAKRTPNFAPAVEKAIRPLNYPWNQALATLEEASGERVNIVRFEQSVDGDPVKLVIAGTNYESIEAAVERLQVASGDLSTWSLQSLSRTPAGLRATIDNHPKLSSEPQNTVNLPFAK